MCLITITPKILTAKKDMTVYKLMKKTATNYRSPYQEFDYSEGLHKTDIGEIKKSNWDRCNPFDDLDTEVVKKLDDFYEIQYGFHFTFNKKRIKHLVLPYKTIVKCTLPKGTKYVRGVTSLGVANQIVIPKFKK